MRALVLAVASLAVAAPAEARRVTLDTGAVAASLRLSTATVRGSVRLRSPRGRATIVACANGRCRRRTVQVLRRGRRRVRLSTSAGGDLRARLWVGGRRVGRWRLPGVPATVPPGPLPTSSPAPADPPPQTVTTDPPLSPPFDPSILDYTVTCDGPVTLRLTGAADQRFDLVPGQAFSFTAAGAEHTVRCLPDDFPRWTTTRDAEPTVDWIAFSVTVGAGYPYAIIADDHGVPVWWMRTEGTLPSYVDLLADGSVIWPRYTLGRGWSRTTFERHALDGTALPLPTTVGTPPDHHELTQLPNGNLVYAIYESRAHVDLTAIGGPDDATVLDTVLQEIAPDGTLVWSWTADGHIEPEETTFPLAATQTTIDGEPGYDLQHVNSIEPLPGGDLLISLRHTDAVYAISRADGAIRYKLGGTARPESLTVVGDPLGDDPFGGQHDARRLEDGTISIHDNGAPDRHAPRVVRYALDETARTATLVEQVDDERVARAPCCGTARRLPGGDWLVAWGWQAIITELRPDGAPVLTLSFPDGSPYRALPVPAGRASRAALRQGMDAMHPR